MLNFEFVNRTKNIFKSKLENQTRKFQRFQGMSVFSLISIIAIQFREWMKFRHFHCLCENVVFLEMIYKSWYLIISNFSNRNYVIYYCYSQFQSTIGKEEDSQLSSKSFFVLSVFAQSISWTRWTIIFFLII